MRISENYSVCKPLGLIGLLVLVSMATATCRSDARPVPTPGSSESSANPASVEPADKGITWSEPIEVDSGDAFQGPWRMNESEFHYVDDPTVALGDDGRTAVAWVDNRARNVLFQIFDADGEAVLEEAVNVSRSPDVFSWLPRVALNFGDREEVYILWEEIVFSGGSHGGEAFFARSEDGGRSFSEPVNLSNTPAGAGKGRLTEERWDNGSLDLAIGADGEIIAVWTEYEGALRTSRSLDGGRTFSAPLHIAGSDEQPARGPVLAGAPDGVIYLAWTVGEDPSANIHFAASRDGGESFGDVAIVADTQTHCDAPSIAVDSAGTIHIVYHETLDGPFGTSRVRYTSMTQEAAGFAEPRNLAEPETNGHGASFPFIAIDGDDHIYVVWERSFDDAPRPRGLGFAASFDGGQSFEEQDLVSGTDPAPGVNGSLQGLLMQKLATNRAGQISIVNSSFQENVESRIVLIRSTRD